MTNSSGPGWMLKSASAPSITAVVAEPGMPSVSIGIIEPPVDALSAAFGPATAAISPVPKRSGCFDSLFSVA